MGKRVFDPASGRMVDETVAAEPSATPMGGPQKCDPVIGNGYDGEETVMPGDPRLSPGLGDGEAADDQWDEPEGDE